MVSPFDVMEINEAFAAVTLLATKMFAKRCHGGNENRLGKLREISSLVGTRSCLVNSRQAKKQISQYITSCLTGLQRAIKIASD